VGIDWHNWAETKAAEARRRFTDEPLLYDNREFPEDLVPIFGTFVQMTNEIDQETGIRLDLDELPYFVTDRDSFLVGLEFTPPIVGHRITRINTNVVYEICRRKKNREWRPHGTYEKEMIVYLDPLAI
jgi:hypothetical protein